VGSAGGGMVFGLGAACAAGAAGFFCRAAGGFDGAAV